MNSAKKCILLFIFLLFGKVYAAQENGFQSRVGIGVSAIHHSANVSVNGVALSINPSVGYIFRDYAKLEFNMGFGAAPTHYNGNYPSGLSTPLSDLSFNNGGLALVYSMLLKGGYNLSSIWENWDHAMYLNVGDEVLFMAFISSYTPVAPSMLFHSVFLEFEGRKSINDKIDIEYATRANIGLASQFYVVSSVATQSEKELSSKANSFGFALSLGFTYKLSKRIKFFSKAALHCNHMQQPKSMIITTQANPGINGIKPNTTATFQYPSSYTLMSSVQFGFQF